MIEVAVGKRQLLNRGELEGRSGREGDRFLRFSHFGGSFFKMVLAMVSASLTM